LSDVLDKANQELVEVARRTEPSVLRERDFKGLSDQTWITEIMNELSARCPVVTAILSQLLELNHFPEKKIPAACLIYGILMFLRCHELSRVQRINTILLTQGQASTNVRYFIFALLLRNF
jgi:hypothetical protein